MARQPHFAILLCLAAVTALPLACQADLPSFLPFTKLHASQDASLRLHGRQLSTTGAATTLGGSGTAQANMRRRLLQTTTTGGVNPCAGVVCPDISTCTAPSPGAAPQCVCPFFSPNLVNNTCVAGVLSPSVAEFLNPHNQARAAVGATPMLWSSVLAAAAQTWANTLSVDCTNLYHGAYTGPNNVVYGQSLASEAGFSNVNNSFPVNMWLSEFQYYNISSDTCATNKTCGHYTQAVWNASTTVGCAVAACAWPGYGTGKVWVCNYSPAGNVVSKKPFNASVLKGPCSPLSTAKVIPVLAEADIYKRLQYPNTTTVVLTFAASKVQLTRGLNWTTPAWACTVMKPANTLSAASLFYHAWDAPVLNIQNTGNVLVQGINIVGNVTEDAFSNCTAFGGSGQCPTIMIWRAYGVQIVQANVTGQIYVGRSVNTLLDSLNVTQPPPKNPATTPWRGGITVHFQMTGVGTRSSDLGTVRSNNVLSNSIVSGSNILVAMDSSAVGVSVVNNYFYNFGFAATRCGNLVHFPFDCHKSLIAYNYIYRPPAKATDKLGDSGALYFSSKWFNPGNQIVCNYITGGDYCMYFDFASSGLEVIGGACLYQKGGIIKINTGKWNKVRHLMILGLGPPQITSCITVPWFNCSADPGSYFETLRRGILNATSTNLLYPYMQTVCNPRNATVLGGINCSPKVNGSIPVVCDALPYKNDHEYIVFNRSYAAVNMDNIGFCQNYPAVRQLNRLKQWNFSDPLFLGPNDYGVQPNSPIYQQVPDFVSCPKSQVGPHPVSTQFYYDAYNMPVPWNYNLVLNAYYCFGYTCYGHPGFMPYT